LGRESERRALASHVKSNWLPEFGPIAWPNVKFVTPNDKRWATVRYMSYPTNRASLGSSDFLNRNFGSLQIDLYCPSGLGAAENREAADYLEALYDSLLLPTVDGELIVFGTPTSQDLDAVGERREGTNSNWFRRVVDCPFHRDTRRVK